MIRKHHPYPLPRSIQDLKEGRIRNRHPFGRDLQAFCQTNEEVFPSHGFLDGGCLALAIALQHWVTNGSKIVTIGRAGCCDHAVLQAINPEGMTVFMDGDGLATESDLISKMRRHENVKQPVFSDLPKDRPIPDYVELGIPFELVRRLRHEFGDWDCERISLEWML